MSEQLQLRRGTSSQVAAFIGAQGETVMDTSNNRLVVSDGSTAGGWPVAKLSEVVTNTRTGVNDTPYSVLANDRLVAYTALTAARVVTLPSSSGFPTGTRLVIVDETGNCSTIKTLTVTPIGADLIDGAATAIINVPYGFVGIESNQGGEWTIVDQGFMPALANIAAATHGANIQIGVLETLVALSGSSTSASLQIPANCIVLAVSAHVITAITGAPSYEVGVPGNLTQFGTGLSISTGSSNYGLIGPTAFYEPTNLVVTATSGSFTGGQVRLSTCLMFCNPSAS